MKNKHNIHSTDIDREQREVNDPAFTLYTQKSFAISIGIGFFLSIGIIAIGVHFGEYIDAFLKTKTGFLILVSVCFVSLVGFGVWRIKKML